ncbi:MAG: FAD-dependent protein [Ethanoligenens sp.]
MSVIVRNIRLPLEAEDAQALTAALRIAKLPRTVQEQAYVVKCTPDLRHQRAHLVYTVGIDLTEEEETVAVQRAASPDVIRRHTAPFAPKPGTEHLRGRPVIVGFGPAGMFAGWLLAHYGYQPLILERGAPVEQRFKDVRHFWQTGELNTQSNVQFGEGGAGTFSDGKLTTRIGDPLCEQVLKLFVRFGAPASIARLAKPHIGTDLLRSIVRAIRTDILEHGGDIRFGTQLTGLHLQAGRLEKACADKESVETGALILAAGHSARDTFEMLLQNGVQVIPKPFSVGVRIEHLQEQIDRALYGPYTGHPHLPKGEYQLSLRQGTKAVYTFCMCPGGTVVAAASEQGGVVTNGMSNFKRDGRNANAALVASVDAFPAPLDGVAFQQRLEQAAFAAGGGRFRAPCQTVGGFLNGQAALPSAEVSPSYPAGVSPARLDTLLPPPVTQLLQTGLRAFDKRLHGFSAPQSVLTGVETRTSSPVRIPRGETYMALGIDGLYPAGEGAGYAGGIMSAAVDGLRVAAAIIARFAPPKTAP